MAKKVLTPEEVKAKMEKKSAKRKLFFGTFTKALAFFLAIAMAYSLATIAFTPATVATTGGAVQGGQQSGGESTDGEDDVIDFGGESSTPSGDSSTPSGGESSTPSGDSSAGGQQSTGVSKADAIKALNDATAKAAKASYKWERESYYTEELQVDGKDTLDGIIKMVDENADVGSVVGGFLDITGKGNKMQAEVTNGQLPESGMKQKDKFLMIPSTLAEGDVKQYKVEGNKYMFQLNACNRPQKDGSNALSKVTNDFITKGEVNDGIKSALSGAGLGNLVSVEDINVDYKSILVVAEIADGKLVKYDISYTMDVKSLEIKATLATLGGSGAGEMKCSYFDFKY